MEWLADNTGTIVVGGILLVVIIRIAVKVAGDLRHGKCTCGGECDGCCGCDAGRILPKSDKTEKNS